MTAIEANHWLSMSSAWDAGFYANNLVFIDSQKLVPQRFHELLDWLLQMDTQLQREVFSGVAS